MPVTFAQPDLYTHELVDQQCCCGEVLGYGVQRG